MKKKLKQYKPDEYAKVREVWYKKLERSGFEDIEQDEYNFKTGLNSYRFRNSDVPRDYHAKSEYYSMAGQFLHAYAFASTLEKVIWEYHSHAISVRNIAKLLRKVKTRRKMNKDSVNEVVQRLVIEMKKMYLVGYKPK